MPPYHLSPKPEGHESLHWKASIHKGSCLVYADNIKEAIQFAHCEFGIAVSKPPLGQEIPVNPWNNPDLVTVTEVAEWNGVLPPKGTVSVPV